LANDVDVILRIISCEKKNTCSISAKWSRFRVSVFLTNAGAMIILSGWLKMVRARRKQVTRMAWVMEGSQQKGLGKAAHRNREW